MSPLPGLLFAALAVREPPDYRSEVMRAAAARAEALSARGDYKGAIAWARSFQRAVEVSAPVSYEIGFAFNRMARLDEAIEAYSRAIEADPTHAASLYDRGEILLALGRTDEARRDLEAAARLRPDHWVVHFRLAELAGRAGDAAAFEHHLLEALRHGFAFQTVLPDPTWRAWFRDPRLGPVLEKLVTVYGDERILEGL